MTSRKPTADWMIDRCIKTDQELKWKYLKYDCDILWLTF